MSRKIVSVQVQPGVSFVSKPHGTPNSPMTQLQIIVSEFFKNAEVTETPEGDVVVRKPGFFDSRIAKSHIVCVSYADEVVAEKPTEKPAIAGATTMVPVAKKPAFSKTEV